VALIAKLGEYPRMIEAAASGQEPHRVAFYLYELASLLHAHWNKGRDEPGLRFVNDKNRHSTVARLGLVYAVASVLKSGLSPLLELTLRKRCAERHLFPTLLWQ
jgi:arginyl-tRNA synthetase